MNPLKSINFRFLVFANAFAFLGWVIRNLLINWYILEETNSTTLVGLFAAIPSFIMFFCGPLGGQLADKYQRKFIFLLTRLSACVIFFFLALSIQAEFYVMYIIFVCLIFVGIQEGMEAPSERTLIVDVVGLKYITLGNSITEFFNSFLNSVGPLLVAILLLSIESVKLFWSLPLVYIISLIFAVLLFVNFKNPTFDQDEVLNKQNKSLIEGLKYSFDDVNIRTLLILAATVFFWGISQPLIPKIARDILKIGESGYGILIASEGFGWMIGSVLIPIFPKLLRNSKSIVICITIYALSMILFVISSNLVVSIFSLILGGIFHLIWWTVIIIMLQNLADNFHRGRVIGLFFAFTQLSGLGFIVGGWSGESFGILTTIIFSSLLLIMIHLLIFIISRKFRLLKI
jgi:MFS family permease